MGWDGMGCAAARCSARVGRPARFPLHSILLQHSTTHNQLFAQKTLGCCVVVAAVSAVSLAREARFPCQQQLARQASPLTTLPGHSPHFHHPNLATFPATPGTNVYRCQTPKMSGGLCIVECARHCPWRASVDGVEITTRRVAEQRSGGAGGEASFRVAHNKASEHA